MWDQEFIHVGHPGETFQTAPERFRSGLSVAFATKVSTEGADHPHCVAKKRCRVIGRNRLTDGVSHQSFPLGFLEENGAWHMGTFTTEFGQMVDAPCDDQ